MQRAATLSIVKPFSGAEPLSGTEPVPIADTDADRLRFQR